MRIFPRNLRLLFVYVYASREVRWQRLAERYEAGLIKRPGNLQTYREGPDSERMRDHGISFWKAMSQDSEFSANARVLMLENSEPEHLEQDRDRLVEQLQKLDPGNTRFLFMRGKNRGIE